MPRPAAAASILAALAPVVLTLGLALGGPLGPRSALAAQPAGVERTSTIPRQSALAPLGAALRAHAAASRGPTVTRVLSTLLASGAISQTVYASDYATYLAATHSVKKLTGTRREELAAVIANVKAIAAAGELSASRAPVVFLTLEKNEYWWTTKPLLYGEVRVSFPPSELVWEHYPGQGIEIQWLATFGEGNGYYSARENTNLRRLVSEAIPLATQRAGGIAWEYMFRFDGGLPPWTSGLSQGTALQLLARAWTRLKEPALQTAAQQALGIFQTPPPQGVRVSTAAGARYAEYTFAPSDRILNGFIQADVGLYDYTQITKDPLGLSLFEAGDAQARLETPHFDTGYWSMYDQYGESDLNYHELLSEFLAHLCERTSKGEPTPPATTPPPSTTTSTPSTTSPGSTGGSPPTATTAQTSTQQQIAGDAIYCTTAEHFKADLHTPPIVSLLTSRLRTRTRGGVQLSLSKISTVTLTVKRGSQVVWTNRATVAAGKPRLLWVTPAKSGSYSITLLATDLAGNFSTASGTIVLSKKG